MLSKRPFLIGLSIIIISVLLLYHGDEEYLQKRAADKTWEELLPTLNQIVHKGDYLKYETAIGTTSEPLWETYIERYSYHVGSINKKNAPKMRKTFTLSTQFRNFNEKLSVEFSIIDDNNKDL